jgi:hypothetical protein
MTRGPGIGTNVHHLTASGGQSAHPYRVTTEHSDHYPPALLPALEVSVPLFIAELRGTSHWQRVSLAREDADQIAAHGDALMFRGTKKGQAARSFNALARGLAIGAYQPGGITFAGRHWCTDHDVCTGAKPAPQPPPEPKRRPIVDVHLPGDGEAA